MGIVEQDLNNYSKELDKIQGYLVRIIRRYFEVENLNNLEVIESIISEAISRFKAEINYEMPPVQSLNKKKGYVNFTLDTVQGESKFEKKTAFNKSFGQTANTVCKGNDPRLSNQRNPVSHKHEVFSLPQIIEKVNLYELALKEVSKILHLHKNKVTLDKIKLSDVTKELDLFLLEQMASTLKTHLLQLKVQTETKVNGILVLLEDLKKKNVIFSELFQVSQTRIAEILSSIDTSITDQILLKKQILIELIQTIMEGKVTVNHLAQMSEMLTKKEQLLGEGYFSLLEMGDAAEKTYQIPLEITTLYERYENIKVKMWYRINDTIMPMPAILIKNDTIKNVIEAGTNLTSVTVKNLSIRQAENDQIAATIETKNPVIDLTPYGLTIEKFGNMYSVHHSATGPYYIYPQWNDGYMEITLGGIRYAVALMNHFVGGSQGYETALATLHQYHHKNFQIAKLEEGSIALIRDRFVKEKTGATFFYDGTGAQKYINTAGEVLDCPAYTSGVASNYFAMIPITDISLETYKVCPTHERIIDDLVLADLNGLSYRAVTPATCLVKGTKKVICPFCDGTIDLKMMKDGKVVNPIEDFGDHTYGDWVIIKQPSYTENGLKRKTCSTCNTTIEEIIPMLQNCPHANQNTVRIEPTCTEDGSVTVTCTDCNTVTSSEILPALGHDWDEGVVTKPPTETEDGIKTFTCKRCFITRTELIPKPNVTNPGGQIYYQVFGTLKQEVIS